MQRWSLLPLAGLMAVCGMVTGCSTTPVSSLDVGTCYQDDSIAQGSVVQRVETVDCATPHNAEVVGIHTLPQGDFPGRAELDALGSELCPQIFADYTGQNFSDPGVSVELMPMLPDEQGWAAGDRKILCIAVHEEPVSNSLQVG